MKFEGGSMLMAEGIEEALEKWYGTFGPLLYINFDKHARKKDRRKRFITIRPRKPLLCYFSKTDKKEVFEDLKKGRLNVADNIRTYKIRLRDVTTLEIVSHEDVISMLKTAKSEVDKVLSILADVKPKIDDAEGGAVGARFTLTSGNTFVL